MARKPANGNQAGHDRTPPVIADRDKIIAALLALLAEHPIERIGYADLAARAGVSLAALRGEFASLLAIYAAHVKEVDRKVLAGGDADIAEEPPRERLFDVLMRRIEALAPHKAAIRSLLRSARRNPGLAVALNALAVRSQQWMLAAAGIDASGPRGMLRAQGTALMFAGVLAPSSVTTIPVSPAPWPRSIARSPAASAGPAFDDLCRLAPRAMPAAPPPARSRARRSRSRRRRAAAGVIHLLPPALGEEAP
jgi:AcrR family transcriptional regulator